MSSAVLQSPKDLLLPYQRRWVEDPARFLAGVWGRQTGKSFSTAYIIARAMVTTPNTVWMIAAPSERQSLESLAKVKDWLSALHTLYADTLVTLQNVSEKAAAVSLSNGSRCIAVPGKPDTVRGMSCSVWLDEFAFFEDPDATWRAILPSISNPLRGGEKRAIITSTPNGKSGKGKRFYDICTGKEGAWSVHRIPLRAAIAEGLPTDYAALAAAMNDPLAAAQELDAEFTDAAGQLLPTEIILRAESAEASVHCPPDYYDGSHDMRLGIDVGRVSDPTVIWAAERIGDVLITRELVVLVGVDHASQLEYMRTRVKGATRVCLDYTGLGIGLGDMLVREFGEFKPEKHAFGKVELCHFTAALKTQIFPRLREAMETSRLRIPRNEELRSDLAAMAQTVTPGGYSYEAPRTREGHSDRCTAAALAVRAGESAPASTRIGTLGHRRDLRPKRSRFSGLMPAPLRNLFSKP